MAVKLWMMSVQGTVLVGVVLLLRVLMKRYPKKYSYMLWLLVLVRLLCPVFIESGVSLQPDLQYYVAGGQPDAKGGNLGGADKATAVLPMMAEAGAIMAATNADSALAWMGQEEGRPAQSVGDGMYAAYGRSEGVQKVAGEDLSAGKALGEGQEGAAQPTQRTAGRAHIFLVLQERLLGWKRVFLYLYLFGCLAAILTFGIQYLLLRRQMKTAVRMAEGVWLCEFIGSPFVLGIFRPLIFLPYGIPKEEEGYILRHERMHIRHQDPLLRLLGLAALCLHWWNPAVWLAVHFMNQDMEMYCDEAVLAEAEIREKKEYSTALLHYSMRRSKMAVALTFGESNTERRVRNIMKRKRKSVVIAGCFLLVGVLCMVLFLTVPRTEAEGENRQNGIPEEGDRQQGGTGGEDRTKTGSDAEKKDDGEESSVTGKKEDGGSDGGEEQAAGQDEWQMLEEFGLAYPDGNGMMESKLIPDMMQPGSEIYFVDDTHFIILSGGLYYDTPEKVEEYKKEWEKRLLEAEENGYQRVAPDRPKAGDYIDYTDRGYAHRIYEGYTLEQAKQRALWPESAQYFGIQVQHQEDAPWRERTDITGITIQLQDAERKQYTLSYQYDLTNVNYFEGKILFTDVNFDGKEDFLIDLGQYGNQGVQYYACFLWSEEKQDYVWIPEFEKIPNPTPVGGEKQKVLSFLRENAASYLYQSYAWNGLELVEEEGLYVTYSQESAGNPKEILGWKEGETIKIQDGEAAFAAWQEDLARWALEKEENAKAIYSSTMWNPDSRRLEGAWKVTECVGTTPIYGMTEKEQDEIVGTEIVYRNRLHMQMREEDGTEHYISILPFEDTKRWMISYQRMDALCMQILSCKTELLTMEGFTESFRISLSDLGIAWAEDMVSYEITDAYDEPYGQRCFLLTDGRMLLCKDGVFFLAEKE